MGFAGETTGTDGTGYGSTTLEGPAEAQVVLPVGAESRSIGLRAPEGNSGAVYIGWDDDITTSSGFPIYAEDSFSIDLDNTQQSIFAVSDNAGDELRYILVE